MGRRRRSTDDPSISKRDVDYQEKSLNKILLMVKNSLPATEPDGKEERMMLTLKNCRRCKGDMNTNRDLYGPYAECLQCGHMEYLTDKHTMQARAKRARKPAAA